jgi:hypothetical protein
MANKKTTNNFPTFSDVISTSWNGYKNNQAVIWKIMAPYVAIASFNGILIAFWPEPTVSLIAGIALMIVSVWVSLIITRLMYQITMGRKVNVETAKADLGQVLWPFIAVNVIVGFITMLGFVAFIVPGIIFMLMYFGASYATVIDNKGIGDAMKLSLKITKDHKWQMFTLFLALGIVVGIIYLVVFGVIGFTLGMIGSLVNEALAGALVAVGQSILDAVIIPFGTGIGVMVYGHLKKLAK